ncbi:MAG: DNA polymerase I [Streptococcaceae bacterium]|jgi:DNA polymerase-1|nr:DNA polymerase I [Streptococcaceae bacterium]
MKKLLLIDGNSIAFKAYFALPKIFTNKAGLHTNAIYGFNKMLERLLATENPTHLLVAFDAGKTTFRTKMFKDYKGGRPSTDPELREQFMPLRALLKARKITFYELPNYEADDIIGTYAKKAEVAGFDEVVVVSGDRDLTQLATEVTTVQISKKGVSEIEIYTPKTIFEKMGIQPTQIIDLKGLMGDKSDNIPGVTKVGEKTALKFLTQYGSIEQLYEHIEELKASKVKENLQNEKDVALLSKELATINVETPVTLEFDEFLFQEEDREALIAFYQENDFSDFLQNMGETLSSDFEALPIEQVESFTEEMIGSATAFHLEMFSTNYHDGAEGNILALSLGNSEKIFVSTNQEELKNNLLINFLENPAKEKTVFDQKKLTVALRNLGIKFQGVTFDTLLAGYVLELLDKTGEIYSIARHLQLPTVQTREEVYGKGKSVKMPEQEALVQYVGLIVQTILFSRDIMKEKMIEQDSLSLFEDIELPTAQVLAEMEISGIQVSEKTLENFSLDLSQRIQVLETKIYKLAGETFNISSPKQLSTLLFEKKGLDYKLYTKKTKTGYSTSAEVLEKMAADVPFVADVLKYRELSKLQSTYVVGLTKMIREDKKIHTIYNQALTATGRLSSEEPNLQNIPTRTEDGRKIRSAFVPSQEDWVIYSSDYSQIELRILAHISEDAHLIEAYQNAEDIHTSTAMRVFGIKNSDEVTALDRRNAKAVNFGVVYGSTEWGLAKNLNIPPYEAKRFIETYFEKYPGIQSYMERTIREAKETGYVETLYHRRRTIPGINERNRFTREAAERTAINTPIQGTAADVLKIAMVKVFDTLKETELRQKLLLQVHDELIFEVHKADVEKLDRIVKQVMEESVRLHVPLVADSAWGETWLDAK